MSSAHRKISLSQLVSMIATALEGGRIDQAAALLRAAVNHGLGECDASILNIAIFRVAEPRDWVECDWTNVEASVLLRSSRESFLGLILDNERRRAGLDAALVLAGRVVGFLDSPRAGSESPAEEIKSQDGRLRTIHVAMLNDGRRSFEDALGYQSGAVVSKIDVTLDLEAYGLESLIDSGLRRGEVMWGHLSPVRRNIELVTRHGCRVEAAWCDPRQAALVDAARVDRLDFFGKLSAGISATDAKLQNSRRRYLDHLATMLSYYKHWLRGWLSAIAAGDVVGRLVNQPDPALDCTEGGEEFAARGDDGDRSLVILQNESSIFDGVPQAQSWRRFETHSSTAASGASTWSSIAERDPAVRAIFKSGTDESLMSALRIAGQTGQAHART